MRKITLSASWTKTVGISSFVLVLVALLWRITQGIDFSDESYYAIFIDDWLKEGIAASPFTTLHQTAALLVYPFARLYHAFIGTSDGLFLFLRVLFIFLSTITALIWFVFSKKIIDKKYAWAIAICVLLIVPFGLPAPSYNTLSGQFLLIALATFGCGVLSNHSKKQTIWLAFSAIAWAVVTVAYPTLFVVLLFFMLLLSFFKRSVIPQFWIYLALIVCCQLVLWSIVVYALSWQRLQDSITFLASINNPNDLPKKIFSSLTLLLAHKKFTLLAMAAFGAGILRPWLGRAYIFILIAVLAALCALSPTLFVRSHDAITLTALAGFWLFFGVFYKAAPTLQLVALLYTTSLFAGCVTAASAFNGIYNFCIGATPAAMLTLMMLTTQKLRFITSSLFAVILFHTAFFYHYGELPAHHEKREWVNTGFFRGIAVLPTQKVVLDVIQNDVVPLAAAQKTILVVGRLPGLMLATPARIRTPFPYPISPPLSSRTLALTNQFYLQPANRPDIVMVYQDHYLNVVNLLEPYFVSWYEEISSHELPLDDRQNRSAKLTIVRLR